jgi:hypothetical protein
MSFSLVANLLLDLNSAPILIGASVSWLANLFNALGHPMVLIPVVIVIAIIILGANSKLK